MDSLACNYNPEVNMADGSCEYPQLGYDCEGNMLITQANINNAVGSWIQDSLTAEALYGHISDWDVSNVIDMVDMFMYNIDFNQDLANWDLSSVSTMHGMFRDAESFNQDLSGWNVFNVEDMHDLFRDAESFNQDISDWDVSNAYIEVMFDGAINLSEENKCAINEAFSSNESWSYNWCE